MHAFHLSLPVSDLLAATAFYVDVLGCAAGRSGPDWQDVDFFGHQLSLHEVPGYRPEEQTCVVDGTRVPLRHHGLVLDPDRWQVIADAIVAAGGKFVVSPRSRFAGQPGEQHTFFITDPSGNAMEIKAFPDGHWS